MLWSGALRCARSVETGCFRCNIQSILPGHPKENAYRKNVGSIYSFFFSRFFQSLESISIYLILSNYFCKNVFPATSALLVFQCSQLQTYPRVDLTSLQDMAEEKGPLPTSAPTNPFREIPEYPFSLVAIWARANIDLDAWEVVWPPWCCHPDEDNRKLETPGEYAYLTIILTS